MSDSKYYILLATIWVAPASPGLGNMLAGFLLAVLGLLVALREGWTGEGKR